MLREDQTVRLTYNRALSTPTTLNLYLDRRAQRDPFSLTRLGVPQGIDELAESYFDEDLLRAMNSATTSGELFF